MDPALQHKNLVAKKFNYRSKVRPQTFVMVFLRFRFYSKGPKENPFLTGERLPVAAKKGHHVEY